MNDSTAKMLHIFNGDVAEQYFAKSGIPGERTAWREIYIEGPLPQNVTRGEFLAARADFLSRGVAPVGLSRERLEAYLKRLDAAVLGSARGTETTLWFDACMFDQSILARILSLFSEIDPAERGKVSLVCADVVYTLSPEEFRTMFEKRVTLSEKCFTAGRAAWEAFMNYRALPDSEIPRELEFMGEALARRIDDLPDSNGLTRTDRQLLELLREGPKTFLELFKASFKFEKYQFMGDSSCMRFLDSLAERGFVRLEGCRRFSDADSNVRPEDVKIIPVSQRLSSIF